MRVVHHDPAYTVPDNHRLGHIAQLEPVGTVKHFILHFARGRIIVGKRGIAVLEISLVGDEKTGSRCREILHLPIIPFHATAENWQAEKKKANPLYCSAHCHSDKKEYPNHYGYSG